MHVVHAPSTVARVLASLTLVLSASGQDFGNAEQFAADAARRTRYSPYAGRGYPTRVFWGDTHLHTALSIDAGMFGNRLGLEQAYRFARGEEVVASKGQPVKLSRPLDFVVLADHSDAMGFFTMLLEGDPAMMSEELGRRWHRMIKAGGDEAVAATLEVINKFSQGEIPWPTNDPELMRPVWDSVVDAAERFDEPGVFTALIGYEWTSLIKGNNLHRVVIYRGDGGAARQVLPFTNADSSDPEDLWKALSAYEQKTGDRALAIPHNGNLSNGMMFAETTIAGEALTRDYAERRSRWEPVVEVTQIKGDGEAHPLLSPDDEFADYETWDLGNLDLSQAKTDGMLQYEYARSALKLGLALEERLGVNPYRFGMIGATDSHTSLPAVEEENFFGKHSGNEPSPERAAHVSIGNPESGRAYMGWDMAASGYAGVWATENTRGALWDAIKRREVYATTGPRMLVRFFGGWEFTQEDARTRFPGEAGYAKGVPMGAELPGATREGAPSFLVAALKDPYGGNLDRIQIVKGWLDADGGARERVYDVAVADGRSIGADGRCPTPVGDTVDVARATWLNTIGDPELIAVWRDPDFDPARRAFYYARVIEIPTPRWTTYDAVRFGLDLPADVPRTTQERAYTSPIWYSPAR